MAPDYGRRLLIHVVQQKAKHEHSAVFAVVPKTSRVQDGFHHITYAQLHRAVSACAALLDRSMCNSTPFGSFAWLGHASDIRYPILLLAAMQTRRTVFFPSPRNHKTAHLTLLDSCNCNTFLVPSDSPPAIVGQLAQERSLCVVPVPELDDLLRDDNAPDCEYIWSYNEAHQDPVCILHTSGSTGIPKPVTLCHGYFCSLDAWQMLPQMDFEPMALSTLPTGSLTLDSFPLFHCAGLLHASSVPIFFDQVVALPPRAPLCADVVNQMHQAVSPYFSMIPSAIISDLLASSDCKKSLAKVMVVGWGGSSLTPELAKTLAQLTRPLNTFGMTETAMMPFHLAEPEDYNYMSFSPTLGAEFRPIGPGQFEMVIVRKEELKLFQAVFMTFPELSEFHTKDVWAPHPFRQNTWRHCCRLDDVIVFSNGEKLNPVGIEGRMLSTPLVKGALVAGSGRFQACLLIEPSEPVVDTASAHRLLQAILPTIHQCNLENVGHGRISSDMVIITSRDKPLPRSGKGSIQRKEALEKYKAEIDALYREIDEDSHDSDASSTLEIAHAHGAASADLADQSAVECYLQDLLSSVMGTENRANVHTDFASLGMDSLQAMTMARQINKRLHHSLVLAKNIYAHPTIAKMAYFLSTKLTNAPVKPAMTREGKMQAYWEKHSTALPIVVRQRERRGNGLVILFTGTTGSLGSYALHKLLQDDKVKQVHCYNRSADAMQRQVKSHVRRGLTTDFSKARFHHGDLAKPYLGLQLLEYKKLLLEVNVVLHNAWPVDFNMTIDSFEPQMAGVRSLIDFSAFSIHGAPILFCSSISTVMASSKYAGGRHPEEESQDWSAAEDMGYAESKLVSEKLLAEASRISGVRTAVVRIGQIAGPVKSTKGEWPKQEWLPSLIASSKFLGALPSSLGSMDTIDWVPVDLLADIVVDLVAKTAEEGPCTAPRVHHIVNPYQTKWSSIVDAVSASLRTTDSLVIDCVPVDEWVRRLSASSTEDVSVNPAAKIPEFFDSFVKGAGEQNATLDVSETRKASMALDQLNPVSTEWMHRWMEQWSF